MNRSTNHTNDLESIVLDAISGTKTSTDDGFDALAQCVFSFQYEKNLAYRNYCDALDMNPARVSSWRHVPALPTDAFKISSAPLVTFPVQHSTHTFLTSGTTQDIRGVHHFPSTELYEASIWKAWQSLKTTPVDHIIFLPPPPDQAPNSSLSHMMGHLAAQVASTSHWIHKPTGALDIHSVSEILKAEAPVAILGTALSFLHWFEHHPEKFNLHPGSWAMETGGYKGTGRHLEKAELYAMFETQLGLSATSIINEYSMTELSSQFYTRGIGEPHYGPPWVRTQVIDPNTGSECPIGTPGYLRIFDIANLHSVMAIQTQDIAIAEDHRSFTLLGRDPSALPRGCSRAADAAHSS